MIKAMEEDLKKRFKEYNKKGLMCLEAAYTGNLEEAEEWKKELEKENNIQRYHRTYWRSFLGTEFRRSTGRFKLYHKSTRA